MQSETAYWGERPSSPLQQEQTIKSIRRFLLPRKDRIQKIYVDFAWQQGFGLRNYRRYHPLKVTNFHESRRRIVKMMLKNEAAFCQRHRLSRTEMWRRRGEYAFVLSPHGTGLDCHRTWEALALGHIVIVPLSSLDPLYTGLPVVPVKNWSELIPENLEKWMSLHRDSDGTTERLMSRFWIKRMRSSARTEDSVLPDAVAGTTAGLSALIS
jgi:hypothetical protein